MIRIGNRDRERISKGRRRFFEGNPMQATVATARTPAMSATVNDFPSEMAVRFIGRLSDGDESSSSFPSGCQPWSATFGAVSPRSVGFGLGRGLAAGAPQLPRD